MLLRLTAVVLLLPSIALAGSSCILRSCSDEQVEALRKFPETTSTSSFGLRVKYTPDAINTSTSDCRKILELHSQDESKTIISFYIQVCSDDGKGQFDTNYHNMDIQHTMCQNPLDTAVLLPASFEDSKQHSVIRLTWIAPCQQNDISVSYTVLDNSYERHGLIEENLHTELPKEKHLKPSNRLKRASAMSGNLVFANDYYIHQISFDGSRVKTLVSGLQRATAIDFHYRWGYLFWTDTVAKTISRSNLDGSMRTILLDEGLGQPEGLAVDWVTDKLYWTDTELAIIGVFDLTTYQSRQLISTGTESLPRAIVVDPNTRMMYWTDWGSNAAIERASMDGSGRAIIHNSGLDRPYALTLDYSTQKLYWIDAQNYVLQSSNVDGMNRIDILTSGIYQPFSITTIRDTLYWTDRSFGIRTFNTTGSSNVGTIFNILQTCDFILYGIQTISEQRQQDPDSNPCVNNGGCSHFCLLSSVNSQGYSCSCPDGMDLDTNLLNCTLPTGNMVANIIAQGSCTAAGFESCCTSGSCVGTPDSCYCDSNCHTFGDCCSDVPMDCLSTSNDAYIIFTNQLYIHQLSLDGNRTRTVASNLGDASGVDYHIRENQLYWTDVDQQKIWRSQLDGTQAVAIVETYLNIPVDLAVDWVTNKLYWIDCGSQTIDIIDLTSGHRTNIIQTGSETIPQAIVLDPQNRLMYWTDRGNTAKIEKASMDGNDRVELHNTDLTRPAALTLDYQEQVLYWGDNGRIGSSYVNGTNRRTISLSSNFFQPFSITVLGDKLYFTVRRIHYHHDYYYYYYHHYYYYHYYYYENNYDDYLDYYYNYYIRTTSTSGGAIETLFSSNFCGSLNGIEVVDASHQVDVLTPCTVDNGGCSHLCLLSSVVSSGFSCACPYGMILNSDQNTCRVDVDGQSIIPPPIDLSATCVAAGHTECCTTGCVGSSFHQLHYYRCYCDIVCYDAGDCCPDIATTCPLNTSINFLQRPQDHIALQSNDAQFQCNVTVPAEFEWSYTPMNSSTSILIANEAGVLDSKYSVVIGSTHSIVLVHNVQLSDQGQYTCSANSTTGNITATATLTIWMDGQVTALLHGTCTAAGHTECCATGMCTGSPPNCYCDTSCHSFGDCCLDIATTCPLIETIEFIQRPQDHIALQSTETQFRCIVTEIAEIEWYYTPTDNLTSVLIVNEGSLDLKYSVITGNSYSIVTVHNIQLTDQGQYTCSANSTVGNITATAILTVWIPPTQPQISGTTVTMEQDSLRLECTSSGYPLPMITWVKRKGEEGAIILFNSTRVSITNIYFDSNITTSSTLQIHNTTSEDQAGYQCEASNGAGSSSTTQNIDIIQTNECEVQPCQNGGVCIDLTGNYICNCSSDFTGTNCTEIVFNHTPPNIILPPVDTIIEIAQPINLTCEAEGSPAPSYEWYKDGVLIPGEILSYLYIPEVQPNDRGNYTCKAINDNGEIQSSPALINASGIYQYVVTVQLLHQANSDAVLEEAIQISIAFAFANTTVNILFYSVDLLHTNSSENASLLFTMIGEDLTPIVARQVLETELQAFATAEVITITRYDGCEADEKDGYSWPETNLATAVIIPCPCEELLGSLAGMIVRYCGGTFSNGASWNEIDYEDCAVTMSATTRALCSISGTAEDVSQQVMNITGLEELAATDVAAAVSIIVNLTDNAIFNVEVQNNYLQTIDNIQQANESAVLESQLETNSSSRLLDNLGRFLDNVDTSNDTNRTLLTFQTFALQAQDIDPNDFQGQTFNVDLGSVEEALQMNDEIKETRLITSDMVMAALTNATAAIQVPQSLFEELNNISRSNNSEDISSSQRLSYSIFLSDVLFQTNNTNTTVGSIIIGVRLNNTLNISLSMPLTITFQTNNELAQNATNSSCATWDSSYNSGFGGWSRSESTDSKNDKRMCSYRQLAITQAHFGILFDLNPQPPILGLVLSIISYIGVVISLVCLTAFILTYTISKKLRTSIHGQILINLSIALMGLYIMFVVGAFAVPIAAICGISSALIHYFILVFFGWTAVEAVWLYLKLVKVLGIRKYEANFILKAGLPAWLVPLLIVIISSTAGYKYYSNPFYCRPTEWPFFFGLILPFLMVYAFNWVMYVLVMVSFCRHVKSSEKNFNESKTDTEQITKLRRNFVVAITLAVVLGLGWGLGLLATSHNVRALSTALQIIFAIFVGLQGVLIFILHGIRNPDARKLWKDAISVCAKKSKKVYTGMTSSLETGKRSDQPSSITNDSGLTTLPRSTLPRKPDASKIDSSTSQMEMSVLDSEMKVEKEDTVTYRNNYALNTEPSTTDDITNQQELQSFTVSDKPHAVSSENEYETTPDPPPSSQAGKRRRLPPQLFGKQISQRDFSFSDLQEYWDTDEPSGLDYLDLQESKAKEEADYADC